jgi:hypothetical protein
VIKVFAILLWLGEKVKPLLNMDGTLRAFNTLNEADDEAYRIEEESPNQKARVISMEGVSE